MEISQQQTNNRCNGFRKLVPVQPETIHPIRHQGAIPCHRPNRCPQIRFLPREWLSGTMRRAPRSCPHCATQSARASTDTVGAYRVYYGRRPTPGAMSTGGGCTGRPMIGRICAVFDRLTDWMRLLVAIAMVDLSFFEPEARMHLCPIADPGGTPTLRVPGNQLTEHSLY